MTFAQWLHRLGLCWLLIASGCGGSHSETHEHTALMLAPYVDDLILPGTTLQLSVSFQRTFTTCLYDDHFHPDPPSCSDTHEGESVRLEAVECVGGGCSATRLSNDQMTITSDRPGRVSLNVRARLVESGESIQKSWEFKFAEIQRIAVEFPLGESHGAAVPVLSGNEFYWCASVRGRFEGQESGFYVPGHVHRVSVDGTVLVSTARLKPDLATDAVPGLIDCASFRAERAGLGSFTVEFAGVTRVVSLEVIDPTAVLRVDVVEPLIAPLNNYGRATLLAVEVPCTGVAPQPMASLGCDPRDPLLPQRYALAYVMQDGRFAVGPHGGAIARSNEYFYVEADSYPDPNQAFGAVWLRPLAPGSANMRVGVGAKSFEVPVTVYANAAACPRPNE